MSGHRTPDGLWSAEVIRLSHTSPVRLRPVHPLGDGAQILVRYAGRHYGWYRTPADALAAGVPLGEMTTPTGQPITFEWSDTARCVPPLGWAA